MNMVLSTLASAPGGFTGALVLTVVVGIGLAVGGMLVIAYLLLPPVRKRVDEWMDQQEGDIWAETLAYVDAQKEVYRRQHATAPVRQSDSERMREPVFTHDGAAPTFTGVPEQSLHELVQ